MSTNIPSHDPSPKHTPDPNVIRKLLHESDFEMESLKSAIEELEAEFDEGDPYWLEGAMESVADSLWKLIGSDDRHRFSTSKLSSVLKYLTEHFGLGLAAGEAVEALESSNSAFWYDDEDDEALESARDEVVDELKELYKDLEKYAS